MEFKEGQRFILNLEYPGRIFTISSFDENKGWRWQWTEGEMHGPDEELPSNLQYRVTNDWLLERLQQKFISILIVSREFSGTISRLAEVE